MWRPSQRTVIIIGIVIAVLFVLGRTLSAM